METSLAHSKHYVAGFGFRKYSQKLDQLLSTVSLLLNHPFSTHLVFFGDELLTIASGLDAQKVDNKNRCPQSTSNSCCDTAARCSSQEGGAQSICQANAGASGGKDGVSVATGCIFPQG